MGVIALKQWRRLPRPAFYRQGASGAMRGLGQVAEIASVISGIIGPLAEAGTVAYSTYAQSQLANKQLSQRQNEVSAVLSQNATQQQVEAAQAQQQARIDAVIAQQSGSQRSESLKLALGVGAVLGAVGLVGWVLSRPRQRNPRRRRGGSRGR